MEERSEDGAECISLQPFIHQVGGHSSMLCLDEATVCKPVVEREQQFYETLPDCLRTFVPLYYGVVKVRLVHDGDYIRLSATTPDNYRPKPSSTLRQLRIRRNGNIEVEGVPAMFDSDPTFSDDSAAMNPWVLKCHREYIARLSETLEGRHSPLNFIVLENLTWRFRRPCILDLKMGTRQYGDSDSLAKRQSKMVKVISTTSAKLGVRIGGMQVYQASSGRFLCRNKLYGRTLTAAGFQMALRNFLHDGTGLRTDTLPPLVRRLESLRAALTDLAGARLYTTSLLLLYDGRAHLPATTNHGASAMSTMPEERAERSSSVERQEDRRGHNPRRRSSSCDPDKRTHFRPVEVLGEEPLTDVRIIDFAHSTHPGMNDKVTYSGPDTGFLFGLDNMISLLQSLQDAQ